MGRGTALSVTVVGVQAHLVEMTSVITPGPAKFRLTGLPENSVPECRDRVRAACANTGCPLPAQQISVELSPPDLRKPGTGCDLAIAASLLCAAEIIPATTVRQFVHLGELGLDGKIRPVRGVFAGALAAVAAGHRDLVVAAGNAAEAALVPGARVHSVHWLSDLITLHGGQPPFHHEPPDAYSSDEQSGSRPGTVAGTRSGDLGDVIGQPTGRRAVEVAAAGGHHLLLIGDPGSGAVMLANRLPGLLPALDDRETLEVTAIQSLAGTFDPAGGLIRRPPFEHPHHTSTLTSLVGTSTGLTHPGAASRAHHGVLFLEQAGEFDRRVLDTLPHLLQDGQVVLHRAQHTLRLPARFQLVLETDRCPCGMQDTADWELRCTCPPSVRQRHLSRLPGSLRDRIDLQVQIPTGSSTHRGSAAVMEDTATVAARVAQARTAARQRLQGTGFTCNRQVPGPWVREAMLRLPPQVTRDLDAALERAHVSIRGYDQILRIAWTLADLAGHERPDRTDIAEALSLRQVSPPR